MTCSDAQNPILLNMNTNWTIILQYYPNITRLIPYLNQDMCKRAAQSIIYGPTVSILLFLLTFTTSNATITTYDVINYFILMM